MPWDPEEGLSFLTEGQKNKSSTRGIKTPTPLSPSLRPSRTKLTINQYKFSVLMKNKITLLFAALMMTLGVSAQQQQFPVGYFPFTTEYLEMVEITDPAELTAGKLIAIQHNHGFGEHDHDGYFFSIDTKLGDGDVHKMAMHEKMYRFECIHACCYW